MCPGGAAVDRRSAAVADDDVSERHAAATRCSTRFSVRRHSGEVIVLLACKIRIILCTPGFQHRVSYEEREFQEYL